MPWRGQFTYRTYHMNHSGLPYAGNFHATRLDRKGVLHGAVDVGVPGKAGALARALVAEAAAGAGLGLHRAGAIVVDGLGGVSSRVAVLGHKRLHLARAG